MKCANRGEKLLLNWTHSTEKQSKIETEKRRDGDRSDRDRKWTLKRVFEFERLEIFTKFRRAVGNNSKNQSPLFFTIEFEYCDSCRSLVKTSPFLLIFDVLHILPITICSFLSLSLFHIFQAYASNVLRFSALHFFHPCCLFVFFFSSVFEKKVLLLLLFVTQFYSMRYRKSNENIACKVWKRYISRAITFLLSHTYFSNVIVRKWESKLKSLFDSMASAGYFLDNTFFYIKIRFRR